MKFFNKNNVAIVCLALPFFLGGCSSGLLNGTNSNGSQNDTTVPEARSNTLVEFDQKLANIKDTESAGDAVNYFANYVVNNSSEGKKQATISNKLISTAVSSAGNDIFSKDIMSKFANIELDTRNVRNRGLTIQSLRISEEDSGGIVSTEKLSDTINSYKPDNISNDQSITSEDIESTQAVIREHIPHLSSSESGDMTPLEASVIAYYMMTGDDGSGIRPGYELQASQEQMSGFTQKLVEE